MNRLIEPQLKDEAFLDDVKCPLASEDEVRLWWLGQSGFLVKWKDHQPFESFGTCHLLIDPYLSDSLTAKYAATDKPHKRMSARVIDPSRLSFIDVVTSSHHHTDHMDAATLKPVLDANAGRFIDIAVPAANLEFVASRLGVDLATLEGLVAGQSLMTMGCAIHAVPSAHEQLEEDEQGRDRYLGYIFTLFNGMSIYHSGDTVLYPGMVETLRAFNINVALLPINGRAPERRVAGNLWGREAAWLAKEIRAKLVVPCHYDMFEFNTATPDEFVAECERLGQPYKVLKLGERLTLPKEKEG